MLANQLFEEAIFAQKEGRWADYGQKITELGEILKNLSASPVSDDNPVQIEIPAETDQ